LATEAHVDEDEIRHFVDTEYPRVVAAVAMATGDGAGAEDAVQEAMVKAWQRREEIDRLAAWIVVVATNTARSRLRSRAAERRAAKRLEARLHTTTQDAQDPTPAVREVVELLPLRQRQAVILHYYLDQSVQDCAAAMGISEGTVKTSLHRARAALEVALENESGGVS
jgi:RNA polymerase sigma-70 factor (ECF subfamily)